MPRVLVVEDDIDLNWTVCRVLNSHGYQTSGVGSSEEALLRFREQRPDLILLDVHLPGADGYRLARQIRASVDGGRIPIIFMTVNPELESKIIGFAAGADDYLVKPFDMRELLMRIQAVLRRTSGDPMRGDLADAPERSLRVGELELDLDTATASTGWSSALLTPTELQLLRYFMQNAGRILSGRHLLTALWNAEGDGSDSTAVLRWHIKNLRQKLEADPANPELLLTVGHHGYMLAAPKEE
ncbi:MAG: response regulator transcription factor [Chloroflexota bacterium]|jgi:two-component system OmpR family response regulator|nr:response regulator transcription factor [Chloroflexota bacterium]